jgi:hypothetical protein
MSHGGRTASPIRAHKERLGHVGKSVHRSGREGGGVTGAIGRAALPRGMPAGGVSGSPPRSEMPAGSGNDIIEMSGKGCVAGRGGEEGERGGRAAGGDAQMRL